MGSDSQIDAAEKAWQRVRFTITAMDDPKLTVFDGELERAIRSAFIRGFEEGAEAAPRSEQRTMPFSIMELADRVVLDVAEIPDRTSPDDQPEIMLVKDSELRSIIYNTARDLFGEAAFAPHSSERNEP